MKPEELRIGNFVYIPSTNQYVPITGVVKYLESVYVNDNLLVSLHLDKIEPIRIDEKWLVKLGFKKTPGNWYGNEWFEIQIQPDEENMHCHIRIVHGPISKYFTHLTSVHELQNLYHSVSHKELELIKGMSLNG